MLTVAALFACAAPAAADDFPVVTNTDPAGGSTPGTLRAAAGQANAHDGIDRVTFGPGLDGQVIHLDAGCGPISIGPGTAIDAGSLVDQSRPRVEVDCASGGGSIAFVLLD